MRDVWLLIAVLGAAVWAGMSNPGAKPAGETHMPAAMGGMGESSPMAAMGDMGGMSMGAGEVCPTGAAPAAKAEGEPAGDACCPTDGEAGAKHDCSKHAGQPATSTSRPPQRPPRRVS